MAFYILDSSPVDSQSMDCNAKLVLLLPSFTDSPVHQEMKTMDCRDFAIMAGLGVCWDCECGDFQAPKRQMLPTLVKPRRNTLVEL